MKVKFARKQFHNSLHDFAAKQIETFKKAVDDVSVGEACEMRHNLLELCLIFTTVFVLYKQEVETVNILESDEKESWNRLVHWGCALGCSGGFTSNVCWEDPNANSTGDHSGLS